MYLNRLVLNKPEVMISDANRKFDQRGRLTDQATYAVYPSRQHLSAKVRTFIDFLAQ